MKVLTAEQMRQVDRMTTERTGMPSILLMENAAFSLYLGLQSRFEDLSTEKILILCGKGNNGGDGLALARQLIQRKVYPDIFLLARKEEISGDAARNLDMLERGGFPIFELESGDSWHRLSPILDHYTIIIDALLGTGLTKPLAGFYAEVVEEINRSDAFVLSVDIPSGMPSDRTSPGGPCVYADATISFTAPKIAHVLSREIETFGEVSVVPIGTPTELLDLPEFTVELLEVDQIAEYLPPRPAASHKGTYGHAVIVAGSRGKAGAAALCSQAALRAGTGLVTVACPIGIQSLVAAYRPEVMTEGFPETSSGSLAGSATEPILHFLGNMSSIGIGPGLTIDPETQKCVCALVRKSPVPLVLDADGLNAFAGSPDELINENGMPLVLTPHPGEFSRLSGLTTEAILQDPLSSAAGFAARFGIWLVLKQFRTIIASPDGRTCISPLGNPGMATAGMGDVLTGILTSTLAGITVSPKDPESITRAVCLGVFLHGLAGDLASQHRGLEPLLASDLLDSLSGAFTRLRECR